MANNMTNFIQFDGDDIQKSKGKGIISTLKYDADIEVIPFKSDNPKAPTHQIYAKSPRGYNLQVGGMWMKMNEDNKPYFTLSIKDIRFNANLGRYPGQDDPTLQAIIPWEPRD